MVPVLLVVAGVVMAVAVAAVIQRRTRVRPERGSTATVPTLIRRDDFERPKAPWLVLVFSSSTCLACRDTWDKARHLESDVVAVQECEALADKALHDRYGIDAVPLVLVVDDVGAVRRQFVGPPTATDLWAAVAELREPGTVPPECGHDG